mmetsp:Transcript_1847/g.2968  ORF Transcript_1847/g.2968 Transcript_1847/m.2968 type:complete len:211 (+) Transcript_1847:277-909(+)
MNLQTDLSMDLSGCPLLDEISDKAQRRHCRKGDGDGRDGERSACTLLHGDCWFRSGGSGGGGRRWRWLESHGTVVRVVVQGKGAEGEGEGKREGGEHIRPEARICKNCLHHFRTIVVIRVQVHEGISALLNTAGLVVSKVENGAIRVGEGIGTEGEVSRALAKSSDDVDDELSEVVIAENEDVICIINNGTEVSRARQLHQRLCDLVAVG